MEASRVSKRCQFERKENRAEAKELCDAFIARYGGEMKEIGATCLEVVDARYVLLMVYFRPEGKPDGAVRSNLSPRAKNGLK